MPILDPQSFERGEWLKDFALGARRAFDDGSVVDFLHDLSRATLNNRGARSYPDLITFGYFCRKASIAQARAGLPNPGRRVGWGSVVHIAPSNIPINFAFSMLMGMVAGNSNILRLPSRMYPQMELMVRLFDEVAGRPEYTSFARETVFIQTDRDSSRLDNLIAQAEGLIVWGGDATVQRFRELRKRPRCIEAYFPSRVSSALLSAQAVLECDQSALQKLCLNFFNDTYLVDQNACSSPNLVFWHGDAALCEAARARFWQALGEHLDTAYELDPVARIDRSLDVMACADAVQDAVQLTHEHNNIWRLTDDRLRSLNLRFGMFLETDVTEYSEISRFLRGNEQTLTIFGVDQEDVFAALKTDRTGVDRIVSVGNALDMGLHWDGRNMLSLFSKEIWVE
jgi:Acyl-CoA reductase (LuxC)